MNISLFSSFFISLAGVVIGFGLDVVNFLIEMVIILSSLSARLDSFVRLVFMFRLYTVDVYILFVRIEMRRRGASCNVSVHNRIRDYARNEGRR
uniref:SSD domain-containing protein n=1 Tax=Ascaris lumbricoides TaxID=6252 RepID=A0A0M3HL66_ASCLU